MILSPFPVGGGRATCTVSGQVGRRGGAREKGSTIFCRRTNEIGAELLHGGADC